MSEFRMTGGCQCGAVRYALLQQPDNPHICHCRMCQKAFGSFFAPLTGVPLDKFEVTRGTLATFRSSDPAERGFCRDCGTPLFYAPGGGDTLELMIGGLDDPGAAAPALHYGIESRVHWLHLADGLPEHATRPGGLSGRGPARIVSRQAPVGAAEETA